MNVSTDAFLREQLCALMDGELAPDEARFLLKRLEHDQELRAVYERWQLASTCIKRQRHRPMPNGFAERVGQALNQQTQQPAQRRWLLPAASAAAIALVAVVTMPMLSTDNSQSASAIVAQSKTPAPTSAAAVTNPASLSFNQQNVSVVVAETPLSQTNALPSIDAPAKPWPRARMPTNPAIDQRSLEGYLVRHNELMIDDGLGGFVPYVDVLTQETQTVNAGER